MLNNIAIISGSGKLPFQIANYFKKIKLKFIVISIKGFSDVNLYKKFNVYSLRMGQGYKAIKILKENNIKNIIFLGGLDRPSLKTLRPDFWTFFKVFSFIFFKKTDDVILRNVISIFENEGFKVIGLSNITNKYFLKKGIYGYLKNVPNKDKFIINKFLLKTLNWTIKDVGQCVITSKNNILFKEDRKGTDNLINKSNKSSKNSYLFIKVKKLHQDTRVDLPTFGLDTLKKLVKTNIKYIILNSDYTVILDKQIVINYLKKYKKTLLSVDINHSNKGKINFKYEK